MSIYLVKIMCQDGGSVQYVVNATTIDSSHQKAMQQFRCEHGELKVLAVDTRWLDAKLIA